jgi:translation initiation factor 5A
MYRIYFPEVSKMEIRIEEVRSLKPGRYIVIDGVPCKITGIVHSKPGKHGGAKANMSAVGIFDNQRRNITRPTGDKVEVPVIEKKMAQVINVIGDQVQLMDMENFETFEMSMPEEEELKPGIVQGAEVLYMQVGSDRRIAQIKGK